MKACVFLMSAYWLASEICGVCEGPIAGKPGSHN